MTDRYEVDKIMNLSGLPEDEVPAGDGTVATWGNPEPEFISAVQSFQVAEHYNTATTLGVFTDVVTIMKNRFYMDIATRTEEEEGLTFTEDCLMSFAKALDQKGFGKTVLLGDYRNKYFMGLVDNWCRENGYYVLYPFSMDCPLEQFVDKQLVLETHHLVC